MKVKDLLGRMNASSNAVTIVHVYDNEDHRSFSVEIHDNDLANYHRTGKSDISVFGLKLTTFSVRDNILTIYAENN